MRPSCCLFLFAACGSPQQAVPSPEPEEPPREARDPLRALNAAARAGATTETLHGTEVADPYRALETDSAGTEQWIEQQNARTLAAMEPHVAPGAAERLTALLSVGVIADAQVGGRRTFYTERAGGREQAALTMIEAGGAPVILVDPLTYGERAALDWYFASPRGRAIAFGVSMAGDERSTLRILDVDSRETIADAIPHTKWASVSWLNDETGFFYTRYPKQGEPNYDAANEDTYFPGVFFHRLGADPSSDPLIYRSETGTDFPTTDVSDDDRHVVINVFRGWSASDVFLFATSDLNLPTGPDPAARPRPITVIAGEDNTTAGAVRHGALFLFTNRNAPKGRVARVPLAKAGDPTAWRDVIPEQNTAIIDCEFVGERIVIHTVDQVRSRLRVFSLRGREEEEVELPAQGSVDEVSGRANSNQVAFVFSSYLYPPTLLQYDTQARRLATVQAVSTDVDLGGFEMVRDQVPSADGTLVPVTLVQRKGTPRDGHQPVLLYGYGGFNVSLLPSFTRHALYWMERGGIYAVANLRGGAEFGEEWHRAGNLGNKTRVFEDFEAVIRWLSASGISQPAKIAITGGSNGGLLMGAMLTRVPETFAATASYVGLYDMVRYHRFPPAELWISEYGSADDADQFRKLFQYSPYHRVTAGTRYPAALIETADHDSRVHWGHSTKFAAALQEATASEHPIHFFMVRQVGHGAGTRLSDQVQRYVRAYTFFERELGMQVRLSPVGGRLQDPT